MRPVLSRHFFFYKSFIEFYKTWSGKILQKFCRFYKTFVEKISPLSVAKTMDFGTEFVFKVMWRIIHCLKILWNPLFWLRNHRKSTKNTSFFLGAPNGALKTLSGNILEQKSYLHGKWTFFFYKSFVEKFYKTVVESFVESETPNKKVCAAGSPP